MTDITAVESPAIDGTVRRAATGDEAALARLIAEHHGAMARIAYVISGDIDIASDAVQAAWATAWRRLGSLREPDKIRPWLVAIAANETRQLLRRGRRHASVVDITAVAEPLGAPDPALRIAVLDLERVLDRLDPDDRVLIALRYLEDLESPEIAALLGLSPSGVRTRLARLLHRLRTELDHA